ncbi:MAG: FecR family protein [Tannerella sp.]|jgi:ferric-dicitrate binding protein FerR (iron transport regulator)|nr:FecR family protein [Tannerella sp.]
MNEDWIKISERFLRNECNARENRFVRQALRDGLIDDEFLDAIKAVMLSDDMERYVDMQGEAPEEILLNLRRIIAQEQATAPRRTLHIPEWLRIAAAIVIAVTATWQVMTHLNSRPQTELAATLQTITVPAGQTVNMTLADGTSVWLNSRTQLRFPGSFDGGQREVWLEGEGFFDVATDRSKPFVVHAGKYAVTALGTQFNVEAYDADNTFSASLLEGIVDVAADDETQALRLQPNMMAKSDGGKLTSDTIANFDHYRWREGLICFKDIHFPELMHSFETCYGIRIVLENKRVAAYKCTGKFRRNDGIEYALRVLQRDVSFRYVRDEEAQVIYIR